MTPAAHPLLRVLHEAVYGRFPPPDISVEVLPRPGHLRGAVVAFTGHTFVCADVDPAWVESRLRDNPLGAPLSSRFLEELRGRVGGRPAVIDAVLAATESQQAPGVDVREVPGDAAHPRVALARTHRAGVRVYGTEDGAGLVTLGRALAGRLEVSFEVAPQARGSGLGRGLLRAALRLADGEPLFAQVAPGNAASLRALLVCGFRPIGAEALLASEP